VLSLGAALKTTCLTALGDDAPLCTRKKASVSPARIGLSDPFRTHPFGGLLLRSESRWG